MASDNEMISQLNELIQTCKDGERGYLHAAESAKDPQLKVQLARYSEQRARFASQLQSEVRRLGGAPEKSGSTMAALHREWLDLRLAVTGRDDAALLAECGRGDETALRAFGQAALSPLPEEVQTIVRDQLNEIKQARDWLRVTELGLTEKS